MTINFPLTKSEFIFSVSTTYHLFVREIKQGQTNNQEIRK